MSELLLDAYRNRVNLALHDLVSTLADSPVLQQAYGYVLLNGGKRIRPVLALMVADALGKEQGVMEGALAVELFHTASLVADDLPCMDDDDERRNTPAAHKKFGEALALLTSYGLISSGYRLIWANGRSAGSEAAMVALDVATYCTGVHGAVGGQLLDLEAPEQGDLGRGVMDMKTGSLFEIAFIIGWVFGGGDIELISKVRQMALHYGAAFQIADDIGDMEQDAAAGQLHNVANAQGVDRAQEMLRKEIGRYLVFLMELGIDTPELRSAVKPLEWAPAIP